MSPFRTVIISVKMEEFGALCLTMAVVAAIQNGVCSR